MRSMRRTLAIAAVASLVLGACTDDDGDDTTDGDDPSAAAADGQVEGDEPVGEETEEAIDDDGEDEGEPDGPTSIDLDETFEHPNGSAMTVTGVEIEDDGIVVSFDAYNGFEKAIRLVRSGDDKSIQLVDDTGRSFSYQAPGDNPELELEPNSDMSARIAFLGRPSGDATSLTLRFNYSADFELSVEGALPRSSPTPTFSFEDLPLPGR